MKQLKPYSIQKSSGIDWLGEIPEHWKIVRVKNTLSEKVSDGPHETPEFVDEGVPFLSADSIQNGELVFEDCRFITPDDHSRYKKKSTIKNNDILMCKAASTGKIARVKTSLEFSVWSPLAIIKINNQIASSTFFEYVLKSPLSQSQIDILCTSNTQFNISMDDIPKIVIALPELKEQQSIATFLNRETARIDSLIQKKERLIELLKEKRIALITQAVTKGLNPNVPMKDSGIEWLGEVPEHWEMKRVKHISKLISKGTTPSTINKELVDSGIRFIKAENISADMIQEEPEFYIDQVTNDALKRSILAEYDVLIVIAGATIGKCAVLCNAMLPANTNQAISFIRLKQPDCANYVWFWMNAEHTQKLITLNSVQSAQPNLSMEDLGKLHICYPPREEVSGICDYLDNKLCFLDNLRNGVKHSITLLREYRSSLINAAVTGKIDVRNEV